MSLVRWDPFRELANLQQSVSRLFDEQYISPFNTLTFTQERMFPVDINEMPEAIIVKAELPGMAKEDIKINFNDNLLTIKGECEKEEKEEGTNFVRVERSYGSFSRSFSLDVPVKHDGIRAKYENGILEITLPKDNKPATKTIIEIK